MTEGRRVWIETAAGAAALGSAPLFMLLTLPLATKALGPAGWGSAMAALGWSTLLAALFSLSLHQLVVHEAARSSPSFPVLVGTSGVLALALGAVGMATGTLAWVATDGRAFGGLSFTLTLAALAVLPFTLWTTVAQGLFQARGQVLRYSALVFASAAANAVLLVVLLGPAGWGPLGVLAAALGGGLAAALPAVWLLWRVGTPRFDAPMARRWLAAAGALHLTVIGYQLFANADLLVIHHLAGPVEAGWYRVATLVVSAFLLVPAAMTSSLFSLGARLGPDRAWPMQRRRTLEAVALMTVAAAVAYPLMPWLVGLLVGPGFGPAASLGRVLLLGLWGAMASSLMASQWILRGLFWPATLLTLVVGVLNVLVDIWAVGQWGAMGAAWTKVACSVVVLLVNVAAARLVFGRAARGAGA